MFTNNIQYRGHPGHYDLKSILVVDVGPKTVTSSNHLGDFFYFISRAVKNSGVLLYEPGPRIQYIARYERVQKHF